MPTRCSDGRATTFVGFGTALLLCIACATTGGAPAAAVVPDTVGVGYARVPRDRVTGAVASVTPGEEESGAVARVEDFIRGRMPGVEVERDGSGELTIRIRGAGTFGLGSSEPLVVLDGMPMSGRRISRLFDGLAPSDIARIDVLKDAGATAPYGILGANGVILITTRRR